MFTIVMYHYVRPIRNSNYPAIKGLELENFRGQLDYLQHHYELLTFGHLHDLIHAGDPIPPKACLLSFDDGLGDHALHVFPELRKRGLSGMFFPPAKAVLEHHVLDVHKIHFILAVNPDYKAVKAELIRHLHDYQGMDGMPTVESLEEQFASANRLLNPDERFIKYVLQKGIPRPVRNEICTELFRSHVTTEEASFAKELYASLDQLHDMYENGMEIGGHTHCHDWLATMTDEEQANEIKATVDLLARIIGEQPRNWVMSYPCGSYNQTTISLLKANGCSFGCTSDPEMADPQKPFELDRLDTIDFPCRRDADPVSWTLCTNGANLLDDSSPRSQAPLLERMKEQKTVGR